jgi:hypothetical protein
MLITKFILVGCFVLSTFLLYAKADGQIDLSQQGLFEGDIQFRKNRNGIFASQRWTNGIIPYEPLGSNWGQEHRDMLSKAMKEIEEHTCIRFPPRTTEENYIRIIDLNGCNSEVEWQAVLKAYH